MTLSELIVMTRIYARDNNSFMFSEAAISMFINQAIDRIKQYKIFDNMPYLENGTDIVTYLPRPYHYMLALFAASRCYDTDERFYEGTEKRNEFEIYLDNLIGEIECGNITILDDNGVAVENSTTYIDHITDVYFVTTNSDDDGGIGEIE